MIQTVFVTCLAAFALQQPASAPAPDRSGEPELKRVLANMGQLRNVKIEDFRSGHARKELAMTPQSAMTVWYAGPKKFRILQQSTFGDGKLFVSDGSTLLFDTLDDTEDVSLSNAGANIYGSSTDLALKGNSTAVLFYLLDGPNSMDKLVAADSPVTASNGTIKFKSKDIGSVTLYYNKVKGTDLVTRVEYDNMPQYEARAKQFPWIAPPNEPIVIEEITYSEMNASFSDKLFKTTPSLGRQVNDKRKKKKGLAVPVAGSALARF